MYFKIPPARKSGIIILIIISISLLNLTQKLVNASVEAANLPPIVFVARQHLATPDSIFKDELGPAGQFGTGIDKYAPGSKLVLRQADGTLMVYDTPGLVDIQAPDVSFDGTKIVFSGAKTLNNESSNYGWRLYQINVDGTSFQQLTFSDRSITIPNASEFGTQETYEHYHDLFPAYLADGRIVFNSSRYPTRAHYDQRETFNVYLMNGDGSDLHRISTERASNLHPTPMPDGRILVSRWWNQFNQPSDQGIYNRIDDHETQIVILPDGTFLQANDEQFNPAVGIFPGGASIRRAPNTWHLMTMNPDGSDFKRLAWTQRYRYNLTNDSGSGDTFAAAQPAVIVKDGDLVNYGLAFTVQRDQTMVHSTRKTGIRIAYPGVAYQYANTMEVIAGLTYDDAISGDESGPFALHPAGLADGRILYSQSAVDSTLPISGSYNQGGKTFTLQGSDEQYSLFVMNGNGTGKAAVGIDLAAIGMPTADVMDAVPVQVRTGWSAPTDTFTAVASDDPTFSNVPNTLSEYAFNQNNNIEMATITNPNVYANPPLELPFVNNSPPPGSVATAEVWLDANQFTGAYCYSNWDCSEFKRDNEVRAVLFTTVPVIDGAFTAEVPADVMSFIVLRDANGRIVRRWNRGYASIAQGSSWARPGETVTCVGCHMGHVSGSLDGVMDDAVAGWTNIAPYAAVEASSTEPSDHNTFAVENIIDRRGWVPLPAGAPAAPYFLGDENKSGYQDAETGWISVKGSDAGQWVRLTWPSNQEVTAIRLVGPPPNGGDWGGFGEPAEQGDYYVEVATLRLYRDGNQVSLINVDRIEPLSSGGTLIELNSPVVIDQLKLTINETQGRFYYGSVAALNEVEVMGKADEAWPLLEIFDTYLPAIPVD